MEYWHAFLKNVRLRRFVVLLFLMMMIYFCRDLMTMVLLTFIFTLVITRTVLWIEKRTGLRPVITVTAVFSLIILAVVMLVVTYLPTLTDQGIAYTKLLFRVYQRPRMIHNPQVRSVVINFLQSVNITKQIKDSMGLIFQYVTSVGTIGLSLLMSLLLSFFFTIELRQLREFSEKFLSSTFGWFFQDVYYFGKIFVQTFGVVLEAQLFIAVCNTVITTICLAILQMPELPILALMIFLLSLIPVAGVIISLIPLTITGYAVGGIQYVIYIVIIIAIVHLLETYILNPQFMSAKTELPIFYTFVVLLIGEHFLGVWGLIVAVPIFTFFLDILGVQKVHPRERRHKKRVQKLKSTLNRHGK
ncbi:AI-2E family transporter [Fructilactobacillus florum]|uniref:AI-2E family transporter n=1 Tax=Fructilactobacillus florum DSM 22689 = JCM 16035 TaxID=1423745 RepID=A0A0R2CMJ8_9LACO|nr:AI-2E family transporter [Fructilactobacillus florum]KRM92384.1 hypothetical protein FC87_GL000519 [Fructilactobacillus florum DSM 22689 = JCM 16035]